MSTTPWGFIILSVILLFIIIGLAVWIFFLYRKPACVANSTLCNSYCQSNCKTLCPNTPNTTKSVSYIIYAVNNNVTSCVDLNSNNFNGIIGQNNQGILQILPTSNISNLSCQWYLTPTSVPNQVIMQNAGTSGYININSTNSAVTVQSGISNASPIYWQINKSNNINYFAFTSSVSNGCSNNTQYITSQSNNIQMICVSPRVTGQNWFTVPVTAQQV